MSHMHDPIDLATVVTAACACRECKECCLNGRPCWGTPGQFSAILDAGYASKLMCDYWHGSPKDPEYIDVHLLCGGLNPLNYPSNWPGRTVFMGTYAPFWPQGRCALLTEDQKCSIHEIKPVEGAATFGCRENPHLKAIRHQIVREWNTDKGQAVVERWHQEVGNELE